MDLPIFDLEESLSYVDSSFTLGGSEESTFYEAPLILNNILQKHAESAPKSKKVTWIYLKFQFHN